MNKNIMYGIIAVAIVLLVGFFLFNQDPVDQTQSNISTTNSADTVSNDNTNADSIIPASNTNTSDKTQGFEGGPISDEPTVPDGADIAVFEIAYNGSSFSPSQLTIKAGDVVIFKNESDGSFWPASGPHPVHTNYPEFDAKKAIGPGQKYQFKFTKTGEWPFHDHLNSSATGKIIVK